MEYVLTTSALSKSYRRFEALKNLTMHIPKGSIYGFVGRNGAGKTTLIRVFDRMKKDYEILSETEANIYGDVVLSELVTEFAKENCNLLHSHEQDESLETYFINLVGGGENE